MAQLTRESIVYQGHLQKRGGKNKAYKKRWFILTDAGRLEYAKDELSFKKPGNVESASGSASSLSANSDAHDEKDVATWNPLGHIVLSEAMSIEAVPSSDTEFRIVTSKRDWSFEALSSSERTAWIEHIQMHMTEVRTVKDDLRILEEIKLKLDSVDASLLVSHREKVIHEILTTEYAHAQCLAETVTKYKEACEKFLDNTDFMLLFGLILFMGPFHVNFLVELNNQCEVDVARVFLQKAKEFMWFEQYSRTYAQRNARLVELMEQNTKFRKRLDAIQKDVGLDLASVLIKPIQRAPKYLLMLRELKKATPEDHVNFESVSQAADRFSEVLKYINDTRQQQSVVIHTSVIAAASPVAGTISSPMSANGNFSSSMNTGPPLTAEEIQARQAMAAASASAPPAAPPTRDADVLALTSAAEKEAAAAAQKASHRPPRLSGDPSQAIPRGTASRSLNRNASDSDLAGSGGGSRKGRFGLFKKWPKKDSEAVKENSEKNSEKEKHDSVTASFAAQFATIMEKNSEKEKHDSITASFAAQVATIMRDRTSDEENSQSRSERSENSFSSGHSSMGSSHPASPRAMSSPRSRRPFISTSEGDLKASRMGSFKLATPTNGPKKPSGSPRNLSPTNVSVGSPRSMSPTDTNAASPAALSPSDSPLLSISEPMDFSQTQLPPEYRPLTRQHSKTLDNIQLSPPHSPRAFSPQSNDPTSIGHSHVVSPFLPKQSSVVSSPPRSRNSIKRLTTMQPKAKPKAASMRRPRRPGRRGGAAGGGYGAPRGGPPPNLFGGRGGSARAPFSRTRTIASPQNPLPVSPGRPQHSPVPPPRIPVAPRASPASPLVQRVDTLPKVDTESPVDANKAPQGFVAQHNTSTSSITGAAKPPPTKPPPRRGPPRRSRPEVSSCLSEVGLESRRSTSTSTSSVKRVSTSGSTYHRPSAPSRSMSTTRPPLRHTPSPPETPVAILEHDSDSDDTEVASIASVAEALLRDSERRSVDFGRNSTCSVKRASFSGTRARVSSESYSGLSETSPDDVRTPSLSGSSSVANQQSQPSRVSTESGAQGSFSGLANASAQLNEVATAGVSRMVTAPRQSIDPSPPSAQESPLSSLSEESEISAQNEGPPMDPLVANMLANVTAFKGRPIPATTNIAIPKSVPGPRRPVAPRRPSPNARTSYDDAEAGVKTDASSPLSESAAGPPQTTSNRPQFPTLASRLPSRALPKAPIRPRRNFTTRTSSPRTKPPPPNARPGPSTAAAAPGYTAAGAAGSTAAAAPGSTAAAAPVSAAAAPAAGSGHTAAPPTEPRRGSFRRAPMRPGMSRFATGSSVPLRRGTPPSQQQQQQQQPLSLNNTLVPIRTTSPVPQRGTPKPPVSRRAHPVRNSLRTTTQRNVAEMRKYSISPALTEMPDSLNPQNSQTPHSPPNGVSGQTTSASRPSPSQVSTSFPAPSAIRSGIASRFQRPLSPRDRNGVASPPPSASAATSPRSEDRLKNLTRTQSAFPAANAPRAAGAKSPLMSMRRAPPLNLSPLSPRLMPKSPPLSGATSPPPARRTPAANGAPPTGAGRWQRGGARPPMPPRGGRPPPRAASLVTTSLASRIADLKRRNTNDSSASSASASSAASAAGGSGPLAELETPASPEMVPTGNIVAV